MGADTQRVLRIVKSMILGFNILFYMNFFDQTATVQS